MGAMKRFMEERQDNGAAARSILKEVRALDYCERHSLFYDGTGDLESAYRLANYRISQGQFGVTPQRRREFCDIIKAEYLDNSLEGCPQCRKALRD